MAHPAKFVPVNLNRSYGRNSSVSTGGGNTATAGGPHAPRYGRHASNSGGGGGMVVLSRPKAAPKLSVPPPLNLPSLRKEHERFDSNNSNSNPGRQGPGHGPGSSTMGWTKPAVLKDSPVPDPGTGSRPGGPSLPASTSQGVIEKAVILKGEDFPTLRAATYTPPSKQRDGSNRIEKKKVTGEEGLERRPPSPVLMDMRPQMRPPRSGPGKLSDKGEGACLEKQRNADEPLSGLPRVGYKSDWEEDERKIGLSLPERDLSGNAKHEAVHDTSVRGVEAGASKEVYRGDPFGKYSAYVNKDNRDNMWRSPAVNQRGDRYGAHESDRNNDTRPYSAGRGNNTQSMYSGNRDWHSKRETATQTYNHMGAEEHSTGWHRGNIYQNNSGPKPYISPLNSGKGLRASDVLDLRREKHTTLGPAKPVSYLEDLDDIGEVNVKVLKKKKDMQKPTEFHDPVRESFEAELDKILRMQEMERQRAMEERARALEMAHREEEERERIMREERERLAREEEEARRAAWLAEQEKLEAARRAEEQRVAREEERRRIMLEEERRKEAARQKLLELEARIARRRAEAHENNDNTTVQLEPKDVPVAGASFGDREDGDRPVERLDTGSSDSSSINRYFDTSISSGTASRWSNMRDVVNNDNSSLLDRGESHPYTGTRNTFQDQEYPYRSPGMGAAPARRDVFGPGPVRRSYSRKDQQPYDSMRMQRWENNPGFNRPQPDFESDYLEGERFGDAGWASPSNSAGSPHAQYDTSGSFSSFTRYRYGSRQPRVLPPPAVTSMYRGPITERTGPSSSSSTIGRDDVHSMGTSYADAYQEASQSHITEPSLVERDVPLVASTTTHMVQSEEKDSARCGSQSSLSVSSPPVSPPHVSHDEMDVSGDLPAPPTSAETPQSYNENGEIDRASDLSNAITDVEDEEWGPEENADVMNHPAEYEGEEEEGDVVGVIEGADANHDLQQDFRDVAGEAEQIILGFDEGVQVQIPCNNSEFESQKMAEIHSGPSAAVKDPINLLVEERTILGETEKAVRNLSLDQPIKISSPLMPSQDKLVKVSGLPTPIVPPVKPIMPPSSSQAMSSQAEVPLNLQFGLFSGPSLIPTPIPAIQIGSIQMPIHLHTQMSPSMPQMHSSPAPLFQFGQLRYASSVVSQGITPVPTQAIQSFVHPAGPSNPYTVNQNQASTNATLQTNPGTSVNLSQKNIIQASQSNVPTINSRGKESEEPKERTSLTSGNKEVQVQLQSSSNSMRGSNGSEGPILVSNGARGRRYGPNNNNYNSNLREPNRFTPAGSEISRKDLRGGYRRARRNIRRAEFRVRDNSERREKPVSELSNQERTYERNGENVSGAKDNPRPKDDILGSGVVRVFEQPGIEAPTDADGFIEVRSKKQMLNDRREKREREKEKEIRPKLRMQKVSRKQNPGPVVRSVGPNYNRTTKEVIESTGRNLSKVQPSVQLSGSSTSKSLPPMGIPAQKLPEPDAASSSLKTSQPTKIGTGLSFEGTTVADKPLDLGSWESSHTNQQVMPLTQSQLEEAMKPVQFEQQSAAMTFSLEPSKPIISAQQKPSPINSLLAGEKIQFGGVTSSPIIPVSRPAAPNGLGAPGSSRPAPPSKTELPPMHLYDKGKSTSEEPVVVSLEEEAEDEAEAAASAVAVAAISNDEVTVGSVVDATMPAVQKNVCSVDTPGLTPGETTGRDTPSQSIATEESSSLTVALPADLSVDTPSLTMWPPLPSPQSTGPNPMVSQFPGAQPSHFSCFEMNPMLGGSHHIFAFGPHDESAAQNHAQRTAAGGQLGTWSGPHPSGVDSYYRPPAGYGGPFIGPGGIQAPPHMVVYNHFTPVGQFGQVGLSFVGPAAYIPTDKNPEWKQLPHTHSVAPVGQGDVNCQNLGPGAGVSQGMPVPGQGQIQHLRPTSPLMQLPMFDISPFQPTGDMPMQACWPHMPPGPPPLHSGPHSVPPLQQHQMDLQLGHNRQNQPANNGSHFHEAPAIVHSDNRRAPQFPDELNLMERSTSTVSAQPILPSRLSHDEGTSAKPVMKPTPTTAVVSLSEKSTAAGNPAATVKGQHATVIDRRGKNEWHRRGGYNHGRKQGSGQDKSFGTGTGRMKQIYVAKSSVTGSMPTSTTTTDS